MGHTHLASRLLIAKSRRSCSFFRNRETEVVFHCYMYVPPMLLGVFIATMTTMLWKLHSVQYDL